METTSMKVTFRDFISSGTLANWSGKDDYKTLDKIRSIAIELSSDSEPYHMGKAIQIVQEATQRAVQSRQPD